MDRLRDERQSAKIGTESFIMGARLGMFSQPLIIDTVDSCGKINIVVLKCEVFPVFPL